MLLKYIQQVIITNINKRKEEIQSIIEAYFDAICSPENLFINTKHRTIRNNIGEDEIDIDKYGHDTRVTFLITLLHTKISQNLYNNF